MKMTHFTDIGEYRKVIGDVRHEARYTSVDESGVPKYNNDIRLPVVTFNGTVKLHGTNVGVSQNSKGDIWFQSRSGVITVTKDNAGFAFFGETKKELFEKWLNEIRQSKSEYKDKTITIYGEWCGGNIQKGVAINGLPKMFVVFAVKITHEDTEDVNYYLTSDEWKHFSSPNDSIYNVYMFKTYSIEVDFERPDISQNVLVELTQSVEDECPVGKYFGRSKENGDCVTGEGIVWFAEYKGSQYMFKTKGQKHSTSKVKTIASVDVEKVNTIHAFVEYAVTENRLNQAIEQVFTTKNEVPDKTKTGDFIRWVINDIIKEELDTIAANGLEPKDIGSVASKASQQWFFKYLDKQIGL